MKTLIIIPAYNESENIERVVNNLTENFPQYDYVIVNDGSRDNTAQICRKNNYNLIDLPVNVGLSGGFQAGMRFACNSDYDYAIQFDGDGQHNPEYIADMLEEIQKSNLDFVIGSRFVTERKPKSLRMLGSNLIQLVLIITTGKKFKDPTSGMRMYNKKLITIFANSLDYSPEPNTLAHLVRSGAKFKEVQVTMSERIAGESYLNITRSIRYMAHIFSSIILLQWFRKRPKI
jgi:glycosyltransferase involved in cell wall biosynthesis